MPGYPQIRVALNPWKLGKFIKRENPTHIHISVEGPLGIFARYLMRKWKWNYTTAYHTNFPEYAQSHHGINPQYVIPLVKWFHKYSSAVLTPSQSTSDKLTEWGFKNPVVWGRGFDSKIFYPKDPESIRSETHTLLYVGRVSHEKNIDEFLKLQLPNTRLVVVGDGPARKSLQEKYPHAIFAGFQRGTALADYYRDADVFVFPSKSDTLGVVMIEAIACGTPVAAFDVEGPKDVVTDMVNGFLSDDSISDAVTIALTLDRKVVAESAKAFSWETSADTFESSLVTI